MNIYYGIGLLVFVVVAAALLIRFVHLAVDREFRNLARAAADEEYRGDELRRIDALLAGCLPLPDKVKPLSGSGGGGGAPASVLLAVGAILLWGAAPAREEQALWFYGGITAMLLAVVIMLAGLRRRKNERIARLLRFRADLKRMNGDRQGAADDLSQLLRLTPRDDAAWAERSDDLAFCGELEAALDAVRQAERLDPRYDEYRMIEASLALRLGKLDMARAAIKAWAGLDAVKQDDPRLVVYRAALELAEGKKERAAESLRSVLADTERPPEFLDTDQALAGVRELLPVPGCSMEEEKS